LPPILAPAQRKKVVQEKPNGASGSFVGTSERRAHPRYRPQPFAYVKVGEHNGGIVMDASEQGLQIAAAQSLAPESVANLSLQLNGSAGPVEVRGRVVWLSESKKTGGFVFASMTPESRNRIRDWLDGAKNAAPPDGGIVPVEPAIGGSAPEPGLEQFGEMFPAEGQPTPPYPVRKDAPDSDDARQPEIRAVGPRANGFENLFPAEDQLPPPSPTREAPLPAASSIGDRLRDPVPVLKAPPSSANPVGRPQDRPVRDVPLSGNPYGDRLPNPGYIRDAAAPSLNEVPFPPRAIFSDRPFQSPPSEPARGTNVRMGLLTGAIMVVCFAAGLIAADSGWIKSPLLRNFKAPSEGAPATVSPQAAAPSAGSENSAAPSAPSPSVATPPPAPSEGSSADTIPSSTPKPNPPEENTAAPSEPSLPELGGNSLLVTAPTAGSAPMPVSLPQEPLTASAWIAIGVQRSALLPPQPGPVSSHSAERLQFGKIFAQVPDASFTANIPRWGDPVVHLRLTIDENGEIRNIVAIRGRADLVPVAERLIRQWRQLPTMLNGQPIQSTEDVILTFRTGP
jgi:PilZ domain